MILFHFKINDSFLKYSTHPITVPVSEVKYNTVTQEGFEQGDIMIILPKGEKIRGHMYNGVSGYGPYHQIQFYTNQHLPPYLKSGCKVVVLLYKNRSSRYAAIEFLD